MALVLRQIIPPVTMRALHATPRHVGTPLPEWRMVRAWDYKQKRALVIAFLHADCTPCCAWVESLKRLAPELNEREAAALLVFANAPDARLCEGVPANIVMGVDVNGRSITAFLGKQALDRAGQSKVGVFVTDRYGELFAQWPDGAAPASGGQATDRTGQSSPTASGLPLHFAHEPLPALEEVLSWLAQIQITCEECYSPHWPVD